MTPPSRVAVARARLLGAAFELLYRNRTLYWLASTIPFAGQWRVWQRRVLGRISGHDVLEVGCGIGSLLADLVTAGYACRAVDASPQMVAATRARLRRRHLAGRDVAVRLGDVRHLPYPDARFDTVVSTFPTEYIADPRAVAEIARVLRPGGRLIVVEGASLLPANVLLAPLALFQALVYGHQPARALPEDQDRGGVWTQTLPPRPNGIPLETSGLRRRTERDWSRAWVVAVTIGEKPSIDARE